jgi:peptidoglycan-associated lipoprotein
VYGKRKIKRSPLFLVVICCLSFLFCSCSKHKKTEDSAVRHSPESSKSADSEFDTLDGADGVNVVGRDIPLGSQPDMDRYFDPAYGSQSGSKDFPGEDSSADRVAAGMSTSPELESGVNNETSEQTNLSSVFAKIYFAFDRHDINRDGLQILDNISDYMRAHPGISIIVEGHCDERGSDAYNLALGEKRALAVREYLVSTGVSPSRIHTISYGEERPVDPAGNEAAWSKNRRVEFKVSRH